jgi:SAM-dependent methyltransferase
MFCSYGDLCTEVYELSKPIGHSFGDVEYYRERLKACEGRILEVAAGTGRVLIPLLEAGLVVDGMDTSPSMLSVCKEHCINRGLDPRLYDGNMKNFSLSNTYEAIIIPAGSFLLIEKREESINALKCFHNHLIPGGRLIIDLFLQTNFNTNISSTRTWTTPNMEAITLESKPIEINFLEQYIISYSRYEKWKDGKLLKTEMERSFIRWFGVEEFKLLLESVGFTDVSVSSDYVYGKTPTQSNQVFTYEAIRK